MQFFFYIEMNRNIFVTLSEAIEEIAGKLYNHNQDLVLLHQNNDPHASDKEVRDDTVGQAGNLEPPADITGEVELHQHNSDKEDEVQMQGEKGKR